MIIAVWCLTSFLMLVGFAGTILPLLPGTTLILAAAFIHKLLLPADLTWSLFAIIGGIWLLSVIADFAGVIIGTRWFGGSKWGMAGASGGALIGTFISLPAIFLGSIFGAIAAEKLLAKKTDGQSLKAGIGAATGFVLSTIARVFCACAMIGLFLFSALSRA